MMLYNSYIIYTLYHIISIYFAWKAAVAADQVPLVAAFGIIYKIKAK